MHKNVIPDDPTVKVLSVGYEDKHELNRQTAFNRGFVEHAGKCGCFHCGSTFAGSEVTEWLHEDGGEDTALCPYCKTDAVIVGTKVFPLSTALLSTLYMEWFDSEYKARKEAATKMPMYKNRDDYKRKGIPFLYEHDKSVKILGEIGLFKLFGDGSAWGSELPKKPGYQRSCRGYGGVVDIDPCPTEDGSFLARFITEDGKLYPFEPWSAVDQNLLEDLVNRYGSKLKGLVKDGGFAGKMQLFIRKEQV